MRRVVRRKPEWERQMLRTEVKHYIEVSDLAYSYNKFYAQNMPDKVAWETLQSDLFANLPQIKAERMPRDFSVVLPEVVEKTSGHGMPSEQNARPIAAKKGSPPRREERTLGGFGCCRCPSCGGGTGGGLPLAAGNENNGSVGCAEQRTGRAV
mgnify:CR=1 FL=1